LTRVKHRPTDRRKIKSRGKKLSVPHEISIDLRKIRNFISGDTLQIYIQNIREQKKMRNIITEQNQRISHHPLLHFVLNVEHFSRLI
jgi:hypothetical protein